MGRRGSEWEPSRFGSLMLLLMGLVSLSVIFIFMSIAYRTPISASSISSKIEPLIGLDGGFGRSGSNLQSDGTCCKGIQNMELWGAALKWGADFKVNSSEECCRACTALCPPKNGICECNSWVFCGDKEKCGTRYGECWLKKQKDVLAPEKQESGSANMWTSGLIFGSEEGIVAMETEHGTFRIKLFPECSPHSVAYILEVLAQGRCAGCHFFRAESRGDSWDPNGDHIRDASFGPPFALIQGMFEYTGPPENSIPEHCPSITRGSIAWVGSDSGSEFLISLANHQEWRKPYTVFGSVLPEDIVIAEKISQLATKPELWSNITVQVLQNFVPFKIHRV